MDLNGVAYSGDGSGVAAVEVSADLGRTWHLAAVNRREVLRDDSSKDWHWVRWHASLQLPPAAAARVEAMPPLRKRVEGGGDSGSSLSGSGSGPSAPLDDVNVPSVALPSVQRQAFVKTARPPAFPAPEEAPQVWCRAFTDAGEGQKEVSEWRGGYNYNGYHKVHIEPAE